jgi:hypothetical protein
MKKYMILFSIIAGCSTADSTNEFVDLETNTADHSDQVKSDVHIVGYAPNGLPIVEAEVFPFPEVENTQTFQKASIEPFVCYDEQFQNCRRPRSSWVNTDFRPSQSHTIWNHGEAGEVVSKFMIYNQRNQWYTVQSHYQGVGAVGWWIEYPVGTACRPTDSYNPTNCTFYVCITTGTPNPRCISTSILRGSTFAFNGESWSPYETVTFEFVVQAHGGSLPITSTFEQLLVSHTDITL